MPRKRKPLPPINPTPGAAVNITDDTTMVYANCTGFVAGETVNCHMESDPTGSNTNTTGIAAQLYNNADANGNIQFHLTKAYLLDPDAGLPRVVSVRAWDDEGHSATDSKTYS